MNEPIMRAILEKIKAYHRILLFRHRRMDGDCAGATKGMQAMLRLTYPDKEILLIDSQTSDFLAFLGPGDEDIQDESYREALGIVLDTADRERISNQKYTLCRELVKIDHHIERDPYGDLNWVEPERSSVCEMVAAFYEACRDELKINAEAATCVFLGMVTDSGRFRFSGVNGETMRLAGLMLDQGVDTETLFCHLYLRDFESLQYRAYVYEHLRRTEAGVVYIYVDRAMREQFQLSFEAACNVISYLENIKGALCWLAFIEPDPPEEGVRVRLRSRFLAVNGLAEKYHGGGHEKACGATVYSRQEADALVREADALVREYKETHTDWL